MSEAQELLKQLSKVLDNTQTSKLTNSIIAVLEIERKEEQKRIIKLIKDDYARVAKKNGYVFLPVQIDWLVALIKGETE